MAYKSFGNYYFNKGAQELLETVMVYDLPVEVITESTVQAVVRGRYEDANGLLCEIRGLLKMLGLGGSPTAGSSHEFNARSRKGTVNDPSDPSTWSRTGRDIPKRTAKGEKIPQRPGADDVQYGNVSNIAGIDKLAARKAVPIAQAEKDASDANMAAAQKSKAALGRSEQAHAWAMQKIKKALTQVTQELDTISAHASTPLEQSATDIFDQFKPMLAQFLQSAEAKLGKFDRAKYFKAPEVVQPKYPGPRKPVSDEEGQANADAYTRGLADRKRGVGRGGPRLHQPDEDDGSTIPFPSGGPTRRRGA